MKNQTRLICTCLLSIFLLGSCKKKEKTPDPVTPAPIVPIVPTPTVPITPTAPITPTTVPTNTAIPSLTTLTVSSVTDSTAKCGGSVTVEGASVITAVGICWGEQPAPTLLNNKTIDGAGLGIYTSNMTGLKSNTKYYVRAYASNLSGTAYGNEISFTTPKTPKWIFWVNGLPYGNNVLSFTELGSDLFITTQGFGSGIFKSTGGANNWIPVTSALTSFSSACLVAKGNGLFVGNEDGVFYSSDNGASWSARNTGLGSSAAYYLTANGNDLYMSNIFDIYKSTNNGVNWTNVSPSGAFVNVSSLTSAANSVFFLDEINFKDIYATTNNGVSWSIIPAIPSSATVNSIKGIGSSLYAITSIGLYVTSNNGNSWTKLDNGLPLNMSVYSFNAKNNVLYVGGINGDVYSSTNSGASWSKLGYGSLNGQVYSIGFFQSSIFVSAPSISKLD